jgi:hypothetical protein
VADATLAMTRAGIAAGVATSLAAGPGGASDLQSMVIVTLLSCSPTHAAKGSTSGGYLLLTPFAVADSAGGALAGNALALGALFVAMLARFAVGCLIQKQTPREACVEARLPGLLLVMGVTLHQSTLFCAIRLAASDTSAPHHVFAAVCAILVCLGLPAGVAVAVARVPRRFVAYGLEAGSRFARLPLRVLVPLGVTQPRDVRLMASSIVTTYTTPVVHCALLPFVSSFASNAAGVLPMSAPAWACGLALYLSAAAHAAVALFVFQRDIYRYRTSAVLGALGLLLTASFHCQIASGFRGAVDATITVQSGLSVVRALVAVAVSVVEGMMAADPTVTAACVLWSVPDEPKGLPSPPPPSQQQQLSQPPSPSTVLPGGAPQPVPVPPIVTVVAPPPDDATLSPVLVVPERHNRGRTPTAPPVRDRASHHRPARMLGDETGMNGSDEAMAVVYVDPYLPAADFAFTAVSLALSPSHRRRPRSGASAVTVVAAAAVARQPRDSNSKNRPVPATMAPVVRRLAHSSSSTDVIDALLLGADGPTLSDTDRVGSDGGLLGEPSAPAVAGGARSVEDLFGLDMPPPPLGEEVDDGDQAKRCGSSADHELL